MVFPSKRHSLKVLLRSVGKEIQLLKLLSVVVFAEYSLHPWGHGGAPTEASIIQFL